MTLLDLLVKKRTKNGYIAFAALGDAGQSRSLSNPAGNHSPPKRGSQPMMIEASHKNERNASWLPMIVIAMAQIRTHPASTPGRCDSLPRIAQAATAALDCWFTFQFQGSRSATLLAG